MSADEKRMTLWALETEIKAFEADLSRRPPRENDVRVSHLALARSAKAAVERLKTD